MTKLAWGCCSELLLRWCWAAAAAADRKARLQGDWTDMWSQSRNRTKSRTCSGCLGLLVDDLSACLSQQQPQQQFPRECISYQSEKLLRQVR